MAFRDVEMAIFSQLAYMDLERFEGKSLHTVLTDSEVRNYLRKSLGSDLSAQLFYFTSHIKDKDYTIAAAQNNTKSGFAAFAIKDPDNNITVACRGTELGKLSSETDVALTDLGQDVMLALSKETAQQADMVKFMNELQKGNHNSYSFTGHSLGGNLAMYGAITLKDPSKLGVCKTFNAPGFNSKLYSEHKDAIAAAEKDEKIISYQNSHDGVSEALRVPGKKVILMSKAKSSGGVDGHMLDDLVVVGGSFQTTKKKRVTSLGIILYILSRLPDSMLILGPVSPRTFATTSFKASGTSVTMAAGFGSSGSQKIQLTPSELQQQASQMASLSDEYNQLFDGVLSDLNSVNGNWSPNLANNFAGKITSAQNKFKYIPDILTSGAAVANLAAINYENTDSLMAKVISRDYKTDEGSIVGVLRDSEIL